MTVESAAFISGLVPAYPPGSDSISEGDDHLRLLKSVLQGTFPNANAAVNGIHTSTSAPSSTSAGLLWYDTTSSNEVLKIRNSADSGWITLSTSPATDFKLLGATNVGWVLPTTDGSANQYLKTDASGNLDWASPAGSELPSQTGNSGKFLTTNGSAVSWSATTPPAASSSFRVHRNGTAQSTTGGGTVDQIQWTNADWDEGSEFTLYTSDPATQSRFTAATAGKYVFNGNVSEVSGSGADDDLYMYKNGALVREVHDFAQYAASYGSVMRTLQINTIMDLSATDYVELKYRTEHNNVDLSGAATSTYFEGYRIV